MYDLSMYCNIIFSTHVSIAEPVQDTYEEFNEYELYVFTKVLKERKMSNILEMNYFHYIVFKSLS